MQATRTGGRGVLRGLVADAQPLWQNALTATLFRLGFGSVTICDSYVELEELVTRTRPHFILVDPDGLGAVERIGVGAPVIVVSARSQPSDADVFVSKLMPPREIERALRDLVSTQLDWATLTKRELEILRLVADGSSNREIARTLWLSDQTVKFHLARAYKKLGVCDRRAAVERIQQLGLLLAEEEPLLLDQLAEQVVNSAALQAL